MNATLVARPFTVERRAVVLLATSRARLGFARRAHAALRLGVLWVFVAALAAGPATAHAASPPTPPAASAPTGPLRPLGVTPASAPPAARKPTVLPAWARESVPPFTVAGQPFVPGESIHFKVKVLGKDAATGEVVVGATETRDGRRVIGVSTRVSTANVFDNVFPFFNQTQTVFDTESATPLRSRFSLRLGRAPERNVDLRFMGDRPGRVMGTATEGPKKQTIDEPAPTRPLEPLSLLFHLRARAFKVGDRFVVFTHNGTRLYRMEIHVAAEEEVWTEAGTFKAYRLAARAKRANGTRPDWHQDMTLWLSADAMRVPLRLSFNTMIGPVEAVLDGFRGVGGAPTVGATP